MRSSYIRSIVKYPRATANIRIFAYVIISNKMKFDVRKLNESDYEEILLKWWKDWGWEAPPKDFLPLDGTGGIMVSKDEKNICAGFVYMTNSKVALTEFVISSKEYKEDDRIDAIQFLIESLAMVAEQGGAKYCHVILKNKSLISKYKASGYVESEDKITELIRLCQP